MAGPWRLGNGTGCGNWRQRTCRVLSSCQPSLSADTRWSTSAAGKRNRIIPHPAWAAVEEITADRTAEDAAGTFGARIAGFSPDIVIDMISFDLPSTHKLVEALRGQIEHFLHCGTIWVCGRTTAIPATEDDPLDTFGEYGTQKAAIETWLLHEARRTGFPATVFRPGHIVGPGWVPINPVGNAGPEVFSASREARSLHYPTLNSRLCTTSMPTTWRNSFCKQSFAALLRRARHSTPSRLRRFNLRGYAEAMFRWFGHDPRPRFLPFEEWKAGGPEDAHHSWEHIVRSSCHSIDKARRLLGYKPHYSSLGAIQEAVSALINAGRVEAPSLP